CNASSITYIYTLSLHDALPILGWEKTREMNFGLDFGFANNRISGSVDVYDRLSDDLILDQKLPIESGWSEIKANVASVRNTGVEDRKSTRLNSSHVKISYAVFC